MIEKLISIHLFVLGHEGETSSIRLMNRSLYRLTLVKTDWLRVSSNLSTGANRPPIKVAIKRSLRNSTVLIESTSIGKKD